MPRVRKNKVVTQFIKQHKEAIISATLQLVKAVYKLYSEPVAAYWHKIFGGIKPNLPQEWLKTLSQFFIDLLDPHDKLYLLHL